MKMEKIKAYLAPYRVYGRVSTTVSYGVVAAIAPRDLFDAERLSSALRVLDQDPEGDLLCVYCDAPAASWDHLVGLVQNRKPTGAGHVIGNLVPCCHSCNGRKGGRDWRDFVAQIPDHGRRALVTERLENLLRFAFGDAGIPTDPTPFSEEARAKIFALRDEIHELMREIDVIVVAHRGGKEAPRGGKRMRNEGAGGGEVPAHLWLSFYEDVFNRLADTNVRQPKLGARSSAPFHNGPFGAFWIWFTSDELRVVCYLATPLPDVNKAVFNTELFSLLLSDQAEIEAELGAELTWEALEGRKACWIGVTRPLPDLQDPAENAESATWAADSIHRLLRVLEPRARIAAAGLRTR